MTRIKKACTIYAEAVRKYSDIADDFHKAYPHITQVTWDKMRLVGVGELDPRLLFLSDRIAGKLAILPISKQTKMLSEKIPVLYDGRVVLRKIEDMSEHEASKSIDKNGKIIPVSQQGNRCKSTPAYQVIANGIRVKRACTITFAEMRRILDEHE